MRLADGRRRLRGAVMLMLVLLSLFAGRLVQLQGLDATAYADEAEASRLRSVTLPATRGEITDRNGVALATTVAAVNVTADQTLVTDPAATARALSPVLHRSVTDLASTLTGTDRFVYVAKGVTPATWREVLALDLPGTTGLPGIFGEQTSKRVYPGAGTAANVVGFVGADGTGLGGLELKLNPMLAGRSGHATFELSAGGSRIPGAHDQEQAPVPGRDVQLTIDRDIQYVAQQAVARKVRELHAKSGTVIVMDPRTGDLLAVATYPTFDPDNPGRSPQADLADRALNEVYEPGSTGKIVTASALIQRHVVRPGTPITVPNRLTRAGKTFKDFENHPTEHLTYTGTLARSSNIGTILAAERMGLRHLYPFLRKFGVGKPTGLQMPGENDGSVPPLASWSATTGYTLPFGQGYSVNAVQMASVFATIANDGVRVSPRLVAGTSAGGSFHPTPASSRTRVVSARTASTVRRMLEAVLGPDGTAPMARVPGYRVAGKTGTAQRFDATCGCYRGYTMSFLGMAPADAPKLVVAVTLQDPKGAIGGGYDAGPVFAKVMSFALQSLRIPPTGTRSPGLRVFAK
jgi:cell division protein FtsI (penicillin-binding protein 3)